MAELLTYGPGIPRYLALWLALTPPLLAGLLLLRVPARALAPVLAATLPPFLLHNPPGWLPFALRWAALMALLAGLVGWTAARVRCGGPPERPAQTPAWPALAAMALLAVAVRAPLAWLDPGISDIPLATETAARQLLDGHNPYMLPNPDTVVGVYQYPAGTLLSHLPFVALLPDRLLGEAHVGVRAALWASEAASVLLLGWACARAGHARAGVVAALAYALLPTLAWQGGMTVANDLVLGLAAAGSAVALARGRGLAAALLAGVAVSVKPAAVVLLPLLLVALGLRHTLAAAALPAALQAPFLLLPVPGLHGVAAMAEPAGRVDAPGILRVSAWWPLYELVGYAAWAPPAVAVAGVAASAAAAAWAGWTLRRRGATLARASAAYALPLLLAWALASVQRINYQDWYLAAFLLCAGLLSARAGRPTVRAGPAPPGGRPDAREAP